MLKRENIYPICGSILFVLFSSIFLSTLIGGILKVKQEEKNEFVGNTSSDYQYISWNPLTGSTSTGMVRAFENVEKRFTYDDGTMVLLSSFGSKEYICSGFCVCDEEFGRRSSSFVGRRLTLLVASVSTMIAMSLAKRDFENECAGEESKDCPSSSMHAEVAVCEDMVPEEVENNERKYFCKGNCLTRKMKTSQVQELADDFGCETLHQEGEITLDFSAGLPKQRINERARKAFKVEYLTVFCKENSRVEYVYYPPSGGAKKIREAKLCVSGGISSDNPSIKCRWKN